MEVDRLQSVQVVETKQVKHSWSSSHKIQDLIANISTHPCSLSNISMHTRNLAHVKLLEPLKVTELDNTPPLHTFDGTLTKPAMGAHSVQVSNNSVE